MSPAFDQTSRPAVIERHAGQPDLQSVLQRVALGSVPAWQLNLAVALVVVFSYLVIRAAARVYRGAVLRLGAKVRLRDAWHTTN